MNYSDPFRTIFSARSSSKKTSTRHLSVVGRKIRKIRVEASKCVTTRKEKRPCVDASRGKKIAISNEIGNEHRSEIKKREKKKEISVSKFSRDSRKREEIISLTRNRRRTVYIYICMRYRETCRSPSLSLFLSLSVLFVFHRLFFHFHVSRLASTTRGLESSAPRSDALSNEITNARGGMKTTSMGVRLVATFKAR